MKRAVWTYVVVCGVLGGAIGGRFGSIWPMLLPLILMVILFPAWLIIIGKLGIFARYQMERMLDPLPDEAWTQIRGEKPCEACGSPFSEMYHRDHPHSKIRLIDHRPIDPIWLCGHCHLLRR